MSATDRYFQSRLCILAFGDDTDGRLETLCSDAFIEAGLIAWKRLTPEMQQQQSIRLREKYRDHLSAGATKERIAAMLGAEITNVNVGNLDASFQRRNAFLKFRRDYEAAHGPDAPFRIRTDLFWDVKAHHQISYRDFSIFGAILSSIGGKAGAVCIRHEMIGARAMGYKSPEIMRAMIGSRTDGAAPLTRSQIRSTVDKLHALGFFSRCYPGDKEHRSRSTFYSTRMNNDQLREAVMKRRIYVAQFKAKESAANTELRKAIESKLETLKPITVANPAPITVAIFTPEPSPDDRQSIATESPEHRHSVATIIKTPLVQTPVIETPPIETPERGHTCSEKAGKPEREMPEGKPTKEQASKHFASLLVGGELHVSAYIKSKNWESSKKPWRESSAGWLFDQVNKAKRRQKAKAIA